MTEEELWALLEECRDFVASCVGSSYHDTDADDDKFLDKLDKALEKKEKN